MLLPGKLQSSTIKKSATKKEPCVLADGGNLYFKVTKAGSCYWIMRYTSPVTRKRREVTLCKHPESSLKEARDKAHDWRKKINDGEGPLHERQKERQASIITFDDLWQHFYADRQSQIATHKVELSLYNRELKKVLGNMVLADIAPITIINLLKRIANNQSEYQLKNTTGRKCTSNKVLALLKRIFKYGITLQAVDVSPCAQLSNRNAGGQETAATP